jgi:hypothetical protein
LRSSCASIARNSSRCRTAPLALAQGGRAPGAGARARAAPRARRKPGSPDGSGAAAASRCRSAERGSGPGRRGCFPCSAMSSSGRSDQAGCAYSAECSRGKVRFRERLFDQHQASVSSSRRARSSPSVAQERVRCPPPRGTPRPARYRPRSA